MNPVAAGGVRYSLDDGEYGDGKLHEHPAGEYCLASDLEACQQRIAEMDVAVAQAVEFAEYVEQAARGTMVERAEYFLSQPYSQRLKMRLEKYDEAEQRLTAAQAEADRLRLDAERLDALERELTEGGPIVLHNGEGTGGNHRGLGLANTGRSLRRAIDDLAGLGHDDTAIHAAEQEKG